MMRQYGAQRCRGGDNPLRVGTVAVGSIFYLQDEAFFRDRFGGTAVCRTPWQVLGFLNGTMGAARRNRDTGLWEDAYVLAGRIWRSCGRCETPATCARSRSAPWWSTTILAWPSSPPSTRPCPTCGGSARRGCAVTTTTAPGRLTACLLASLECPGEA